MRRQRNMPPIKAQSKSPEKELSEMEIINLSGAKFKTLVVRMFNELKRVDELSENFNKEVGNKTEIKNTLWGFNSRVDEAEDQISNLKDKGAENTQSEQQKEKRIQKRMRIV